MTSYHVMGQTSTAAQQCTQQIQAILKTCSNNNGINEANFLWFTTNGTSKNGQAPADETAFRDQICQVEINIGQCVLTQAGPLFNTTCQSSPQIAQSVDSLFFTYDAKCAHPCRGP
nr:hypothetical protein BaRGS_005369 [Batillaria attramentaria]